MLVLGDSRSSTMATHGLDILESTKPLVIAFTGLVTFAVILLGYLYLHRRALQDAVNTAHTESTVTEQKEDEVSEDDEAGIAPNDDAVARCTWPVGKELLYTIFIFEQHINITCPDMKKNKKK